MTSFADIVSKADRYGLVIRGGFNVETDDDVPAVDGKNPACSLILFGNVGSSIWPVFSNSPEHNDGEKDALDRWSLRVGQQMADELNGSAFFPFGGPPYHPFIRWAKRGEDLMSSKLGMLIHPKYGLWHAYRFAIGLPDRYDELVPAPVAADICASCQDQPCLSGCPVGAFCGSGYDIERCFHYLQNDETKRCVSAGCQARMACPQGISFRYEPAHAKFHMDAFYDALSIRFKENTS